MHRINAEMKSCINECLAIKCAYRRRWAIVWRPIHFSLMMACAEICRTSAHFMSIGSELHKHTCRICSEICEPRP
jgi:hypothetical protein